MAKLCDMTQDEQDDLRDRIAMAALTGLLASPNLAAIGHLSSTIEALAYNCADAMLAVRDPEPTK